MIKTVTYIGDPIDDSAEFLGLEKQAEMAMVLWHVDQKLREIDKYGRDGFDVETVEKIREIWFEETETVRDIINN